MYMGTAAISDGDYIHHAINHSDLIILVGHDVRPRIQCTAAWTVSMQESPIKSRCADVATMHHA